MSKRMNLSSVVILVTAAATALAQNQPPQFKARELFYNPIVPAKPTPKQEVTAPVPETKPVVTKQTASNPKSKVTKPVGKEEHKQEPVVAGNTSRPAQNNTQRQNTNTSTYNDPRFQNVALSNNSTIPLAFRYTIQRKSSAGKFEDASVDATFRSGDRVRVTIESNDTAYLYIVQQGSRKTWDVLFPRPDINGGNNEVKANAKITIPSEYAFSFDDQPGVENVYIVLSRKPEPDFEKLIFALRDNKGANPDTQTMPVNTEPRYKGKVVQMASARTNNPLLEQLESMKSRDLVFEKVDEDNAQGPKEKAFYAGTPDTSANARVVARVELKHE